MSARSDIDVPGTYVFDGEQSRRGYRLNKMCQSLRATENRARFGENEAAYCDAYGLSAEQKKAVLTRDWVSMLDLGGNIFYVYKLAIFDDKSLQYLGGAFCGMTEEQFVQMMVGGGRSDG